MADEDDPNTIPTNAAKGGGKAARTKTQHALPTDRMAFAKQVEALRAYGQLGATGGSVSNNEVAGMIQLTPSTTSLVNSFLVDVGLLQKASDGLAPSQEVIAFSRAWEWNQETAGEKLAPVFEASWIGPALLRKVRFRPHTTQEALAALADASGASQSHRSQLETILEFVELAGLVDFDGDSAKPGKMMQPGSAAAPAPAHPEPAPPVKQADPVQTTAAPPGVSFNISLSVTMAEIAQLPPEKITAFFTGVATVVGVQAEIDAIRKGTPRAEHK